jgi:hypothetical protein
MVEKPGPDANAGEIMAWMGEMGAVAALVLY